MFDGRMTRICSDSDCQEDWKGPVCPYCGCDSYDDISVAELEERRTGGLDWDA